MAKTGTVTRTLWRVESWELVAITSPWFLFLDLGHHTYWENLTGGWHAVTGSTGNDAGVAASARAMRQFSYSFEVMKVKENLGEAKPVNFTK
jgi:hypothetical protein